MVADTLFWVTLFCWAILFLHPSILVWGCSGGLAAQQSNPTQQRQVRWADIAANAALDAGVQPISLGEALVLLLCCLEQAGGVDAHRTSLDAPAAADAGIGVDVRLAPADIDSQFAAGDDALTADAHIPQRPPGS